MPMAPGGSTVTDWHAYVTTKAGMRTLRTLKIVLLLVCLVAFCLVVFLIRELYLDAANRAKDVISQGRLAQIEAMLLIYHDKHGAFPPTKYQPEPGGPIHSWRVLLVPHTSPYAKEGYSNYDFSQEWDSSNNLHALVGKPSRYFSVDGDGDTTHYLAIGPDDEWPSRKPLRSLLVTKGRDRFLLVEDRDSKIPWMEPKY
jgi:hypothetical protein